MSGAPAKARTKQKLSEVGRKVSPFDGISPTDYRYKVRELVPFLSEEAYVAHKSEMEIALATTLMKSGHLSPEAEEQIRVAAKGVRAADVYWREQSTQHDILAQVGAIRARLPKGSEAQRSVHKTATSYDIVDSANALRYRRAFTQIVIPDMIAFERVLIAGAKEFKDTYQIGRTHLQHAEPISVGFALAWHAHRFGTRILATKQAVGTLEGKFAGAVGTHSAASLFVNDPLQFEADVLGQVGLKPALISTQIVPPEPLVDLNHAVISAFGVVHDWAVNMYQLQRPEIDEIGQPRGEDTSRSSTMPFKKNPVGLENIAGLWRVMMPRIITSYLDQTSLHSRDLMNSAPERWMPELYDIYDFAVRRATRIAKTLKPNPKSLLRNLETGAAQIVGEPLYLLLAGYGHPNAHEYVAELADAAMRTGKPLLEVARGRKSLKPYFAQFTPEQVAVLEDPKKYLGLASAKAASVADHWEEVLRKEFATA